MNKINFNNQTEEQYQMFKKIKVEIEQMHLAKLKELLSPSAFRAEVEKKVSEHQQNIKSTITLTDGNLVTRPEIVPEIKQLWEEELKTLDREKPPKLTLNLKEKIYVLEELGFISTLLKKYEKIHLSFLLSLLLDKNEQNIREILTDIHLETTKNQSEKNRISTNIKNKYPSLHELLERIKGKKDK
jgi:hypothetical protein